MKNGLGQMVKAATQAKDLNDKRAALRGGHSGRYYALNLTNLCSAYAGKFTAEFRYQAGTTSFEKIQMTICTCLGLAMMARSARGCNWTDLALPTFPSWKGTAVSCQVHRLLLRLGWMAGQRTDTVGFVGTQDQLVACRKEMRRLAAKYEGRVTEAVAA